MSATEEREIEIVAGTIGGITQKKADTWTVAVTPDGSQYAKNLWTKDVELVESLSAKIGQAGAFVCSASYWKLDGKDVRSLWIQQQGEQLEATITDGSPQPVSSVATPAAAPSPAVKSGSNEMSKEEWARKDSAIHKMACLKAAAGALTHTVPSDPNFEDLNKFLERTVHVAAAWHRAVLAERDDPTGEDVPF